MSSAATTVAIEDEWQNVVSKKRRRRVVKTPWFTTVVKPAKAAKSIEDVVVEYKRCQIHFHNSPTAKKLWNVCAQATNLDEPFPENDWWEQPTVATKQTASPPLSINKIVLLALGSFTEENDLKPPDSTPFSQLAAILQIRYQLRGILSPTIRTYTYDPIFNSSDHAFLALHSILSLPSHEAVLSTVRDDPSHTLIFMPHAEEPLNAIIMQTSPRICICNDLGMYSLMTHSRNPRAILTFDLVEKSGIWQKWVWPEANKFRSPTGGYSFYNMAIYWAEKGVEEHDVRDDGGD